MIGSAGEEIGERANGWLSPKDIPLLSRNLLSDDSGNDSRFTENLDTRLKSVGLANSRHYTTSHDTWKVSRNCYVFSRLRIFIPICSEKKSAAVDVGAFVNLCRSLPRLFLTTVGFRRRLRRIKYHL